MLDRAGGRSTDRVVCSSLVLGDCDNGAAAGGGRDSEEGSMGDTGLSDRRGPERT